MCSKWSQSMICRAFWSSRCTATTYITLLINILPLNVSYYHLLISFPYPFSTLQQRLNRLEQFTQFKGLAQANERTFV